MQHTLIAVFDNRTDAQAAMDELMLSNFSRQDVRLSNDTASMADAPAAEPAEEESIGASIKHFFSDLFGSDDDVYSNRYSTAVGKGHHVLTVTARSEADVERAGDIVDRFGPVDIEEKEAEWGGASMPNREAMRVASAGSMQQTEATTLHFQQDRNLFAQQSLSEERPMGHTYQEPMGQPSRLTSVRRGGVRVFTPLTPERSKLDDQI